MIASQLPAAELVPKAIPRMQVIPLPHHEFSFQRRGQELTRFHYSPLDKRPFLYPINGPSGHTLTRMGHPHDPFTHSHHNSLWLAHQNVNGVNFWEDRGPAQIRLERVVEFTDGDDACSATVLNAWQGTNRMLLREYRRMTIVDQRDNQWLLLLDVKFEAASGPVTFGRTPFGLAAVRMAKSIGVNDGGGLIRNSEGGVNEPGVFWKPARWVDYSGAIARDTTGGVTLFDHPMNPNHPSVFHVRNDGWMGASLTYTNALTVETNKPLVLRYGFFVHGGLPTLDALNARWKDFTALKFEELPRAKR
jgi:hypothetical protein